MIARVIALALALALAPTLVHAQESAIVGAAAPDDDGLAEFRTIVLDALREYDSALYAEALASFERALALRPSARVLRGIGKSLFELRRYAESIRALDRALASDVDPLTDALRVEVTELSTRAHRYVGTLRVEIAPAGAVLRVDGRAAEVSSPILLDAGTHTLAASAEGMRPTEQEVWVEAGSDETLRWTLHPDQEVTVVRVTQAAPRDDAPWVVSGVTLLVVGAAGSVGSATWLANRDSAVGACNRAAEVGAECDNAPTISLQRDLSIWGLGLSIAFAVAGAAVLVVGAASGSATPASEAPVAACAPMQDGMACGARIAW